ncbi:hypothetical protein Tco_0315661, partial [Tanacetum coccineum]
IIMAQQQHAADVHPDELCPPNKRYDLMDANKKVDLDHMQCPPESKILTNIIKNHPLRFSIAASSSVPWIYMAQFWHTLKEDRSKYRLKFMLDKKELNLTLDDFRTIFHLPQATDNNHNSFVPPPSFSEMVPFYKQVLGFTMELKTPSSFKTTGVQMLDNTCHWMGSTAIADNANVALLCQQHSCGLCGVTMGRTLLFASSSNIFDSISKIYKDHYVSLTQSQPTKSTHGTHRTTSIPRSPNPDKEAAESSAPRRSTVILLHIPERRSTRLTPPALVPTNIVDDSSIPRNDESNIPGTRIEPRSNKEIPEVEITKEKEVEIIKETPVVDITNVVIPVNVNDEDEEITDEVYELKRREKGKLVEETRNSPIPTPIRSPRIYTNLVSSDTKKLQELMDTPHTTSSSSSPHKKLAKTNRHLSLFKTKPTRFK